MAKNQFSAIILAAGQGTRMKSPLPKVLHPVAGLPMIQRVIHAVQGAGGQEVRIVVGFAKDLVRQVVEPLGATCFIQKEQKGTADAVHSADLATLDENVLILNGDHPLLKAEDLRRLFQDYLESKADLAVVSVELSEPGSFGRIVRSQGRIHTIVEAKDASAETLKIKEVNTGIYFAKAEVLNELIPMIKNQNAQKEFYLTDLISLGLEQRKKVEVLRGPEHVAFGVNSQRELAEATRRVFLAKAQQLMDDGVVIMDPLSTYIEDTVEIGFGTVLFPNIFLRGKTRISSFCSIEPHTMIVNSQIGESVQIKAGCYIDSSKIENKVSLGPYAHLRPGSSVGEEAKIGNFVELKNVHLGARSKASHLTYLGDAEIGTDTNIGCGTITCNYAANHKKYRTIIGNHVFVGSDTQFIAPVKIGDHAVIGSGSTITKDVPPNALAVARGRQVIKENYTTPTEDKKTSSSKE